MALPIDEDYGNSKFISANGESKDTAYTVLEFSNGDRDTIAVELIFLWSKNMLTGEFSSPSQYWSKVWYNGVLVNDLGVNYRLNGCAYRYNTKKGVREKMYAASDVFDSQGREKLTFEESIALGVGIDFEIVK